MGRRGRDGESAGRSGDLGIRILGSPMLLIAQIALGVIVGGLTIALLVISFFIWNSRQKNERMAVGLFIAGAVIVLVLLAVVASQ